MKEWISVEDRLPEKYIDHLVYATGCATGCGGDKIITVSEWDDGFDLQLYEVTHWMPLPEPPK